MLLLARLICSDDACADLCEEHVGSLAELDALVCGCGCCWELLSVSLAAPEAAAAPPLALAA